MLSPSCEWWWPVLRFSRWKQEKKKYGLNTLIETQKWKLLLIIALVPSSLFSSSFFGIGSSSSFVEDERSKGSDVNWYLDRISLKLFWLIKTTGGLETFLIDGIIIVAVILFLSWKKGEDSTKLFDGNGRMLARMGIASALNKKQGVIKGDASCKKLSAEQRANNID